MSDVTPGKPVLSCCVDLESNFARLQRLIYESFDAPLTDVEDDPQDDVEDISCASYTLPNPSSSSAATSSSGNPKTTASNKRFRARRLIKRSSVQQSNNTHLKDVSLKRRAQAPPRKIAFNMAQDVRASKPGWTGASAELGSLNGRKTITPEEAKEIGIVELAWDGRWVFLEVP